MTGKMPNRTKSVLWIDGMNFVVRVRAKILLCGLVLLLSAAGCAVDDHRQAQTPASVSVYVPPEVDPGPSPANGRREIELPSPPAPLPAG